MRFRLGASLLGLTVATLFTAGWMINQAVLGGSGAEGANKESMAQELAQSPGNQNSPVSSTENKDADTFAAYGSPKDPFKPVLKPNGSGGSPAGGTGSNSGNGTNGNSGTSGRNRPIVVPVYPRGHAPGNNGSGTSSGGGRTGTNGSNGGQNRFNPGGSSGNNIPGGVRKRGGDRFDNGQGGSQSNNGGGFNPPNRTNRGTTPGNGAGGAGGQLPNTGGELPDTGGEIPRAGVKLPYTGGGVFHASGENPFAVRPVPVAHK